MKTLQIITAVALIFALSSFSAPDKADSIITEPCLSGIVSDATTGETLVGVEVSLEGTKFKTYTNFDGEFSFAGIKPGSYKVITSYVSYEKSQLKTITLQNNEVHSLTVQLQPQIKDTPLKTVMIKNDKILANNTLKK